MAIFGLILITPIGKATATTNSNLQISDENGFTVSYSHDQLLAMPTTTVTANLYCYGGFVAGGDWVGVSLSYLLKTASMDSSVQSVNFVASDGYSVQIPIYEALESNVIIAYQLDSSPLSESLRLVLPNENGDMWISMITTINMETTLVSSRSEVGANLVLPNSFYSSQQSQGQQPVQTAPPTKTTTDQSAVPPTNTTVPIQQPPVQQESSPKGPSFPTLALYGIAIGVTLALVVATIGLIKRRKV